MLRDEVDTLHFHERKERMHKDKILCVDKIVRLPRDRLELFVRCHARDVAFAVSRMLHVDKGCDPYHEKFIKVRCGDRQKLEPLHERIRSIRRLSEHALVKHQP